jgi:hypothetical protein
VSNDIGDTAALRRRVELALPRVEALAAQEPAGNWLRSIIVQLRYIADAAAAGETRLGRFGELNFALLASHYIDDVDPPLAEELHVINTAVHRLYGGKNG